MSIKQKIIAFLMVVSTSTFSMSTIAQDADRQVTNIEDGTHNGFYYRYWSDSVTSNMDFQLLENGRYIAEWDDSVFSWFGGKGWNSDFHDRVVNYSGTFNISNSQNAFLSLYGWTTGGTSNSRAEYYIVETYGAFDPSNCSNQRSYGSIRSDGATYNLFKCQVVPSGLGDPILFQYYSVRNSKKPFGLIRGSITVANHFEAWASKGEELGTHQGMILATEGYQSAGRVDLIVEDVGAGWQSSGGSLDRLFLLMLGGLIFVRRKFKN